MVSPELHRPVRAFHQVLNDFPAFARKRESSEDIYHRWWRGLTQAATLLTVTEDGEIKSPFSSASAAKPETEIVDEV